MIQKNYFKEFYNSEKAGGALLLVATAVSIIIVNFFDGDLYSDFWHTQVAGSSINHWINDGLMAVFFLLIGLELEREIYIGELSKPTDALLPVFAAVGGMLIPLLIFTAYNFGSSGQSGVGIPMATDIAFALGILSLLGNRIPLSLKIFLTAFAVIDDLGAILIIAFFYTKSLSVNHLIISILIFFVLIFLNRRKVSLLLVYIIGGILMWYFMYKSGVHATIAGVLLAFAIPFQSNSESSPSKRLLRLLHKPVAFLILPLFALANTAIVININDVVNTLTQPLSKGIFFGLVIGKPLGILLFSIIGLKIGICKLPSDLNWKSILGAGFLGGIGFTMSIFITLLAFGDELVITQSKIIILMSSLVSGLMGLLFLKTIYNKTSKML